MLQLHESFWNLVTAENVAAIRMINRSSCRIEYLDGGSNVIKANALGVWDYTPAV